MNTNTTSIRSTKIQNRKFFAARDVFSSLGLPWQGLTSLNKFDVKGWTTAKFSTKVGRATCNLTNFVMTSDAVTNLKAQVKRGTVKTKVTATTTNTAFPSLASVSNISKVTGRPGKGNQGVARASIGRLVTQFVDGFAPLNNTAKSDLYDMAYTKLYSAYKRLTKIDLSALAKKGNVSGLQIAENKKIATDLLRCAKQLFVASK